MESDVNAKMKIIPLCNKRYLLGSRNIPSVNTTSPSYTKFMTTLKDSVDISNCFYQIEKHFYIIIRENVFMSGRNLRHFVLVTKYIQKLLINAKKKS